MMLSRSLNKIIIHTPHDLTILALKVIFVKDTHIMDFIFLVHVDNVPCLPYIIHHCLYVNHFKKMQILLYIHLFPFFSRCDHRSSRAGGKTIMSFASLLSLQEVGSETLQVPKLGTSCGSCRNWSRKSNWSFQHVPALFRAQTNHMWFSQLITKTKAPKKTWGLWVNLAGW